jgi:two-component system cell cycle response regulator DivK
MKRWWHVPGERVLIVEDNDRNRELIRDILDFHGFELLEASNATDAIALAIGDRPDVVLMDIQLPDLDGNAALRQLRTNPKTADIRVVALTAFAMKGDRQRFLTAGFDGYLEKPVDVRTLAAQVRSYCR